MVERVTVDLPYELAERVRMVAARTHRPFEAVLVEWIHRGGAEPNVESLADDDLLAIVDAELPIESQEELSDLLDLNREGELSLPDRSRLDELMRTYRRGLVQKSQAIREAVARGLRPGLN